MNRYKYRLLSSVCKYSELRVNANVVDELNYITTENMLPNNGGIKKCDVVPDLKTYQGYLPNNILLSNILPYFKKIWYANRSGGCSNDVLVLEVNKDISPKFIYYVLSDSNFFNYDYVTSKGTKMPRGSKSAIMKYLVPDISFQLQVKIASILSTYDSLIENNTRRIALLEKMAQELYKEWFVRFRFPGHEHVRMVNGVPEGWIVQTIENISDVLQRGISPEYNDFGKYTVISQKCIRTNIMDISESRRQDKIYNSILNLHDGDTLICSTGTGTLGRVGKVFGDFPNTTIDSHVTLIRANKDTGKHYLYYSVKQLQPYFMNLGIGSTNQQELYRGTIKTSKVIIPNRAILNKFEQIVEQIHKCITNVITKNQNLIKQRDLLLPRLMSGKLELP